MSRTDDTTPKILSAMANLGPAEARTIAEQAGVGYSTAVRKLRQWGEVGEVTRIDRGSDPAHWRLNAGTAPAHTITAPATDTPVAESAESAESASAPAAPPPAPGAGTEPVSAGDTDVSHDRPAAEEQPDTPTAASTAIGDTSAETTPTDTAPAAGSPHPGGQPQPTPPRPTPAAEATADPQTPATTGGMPRRRKGQLAQEVLAILQANPDTEYKVGEVCKLIQPQSPGRKTSGGAVANALHKFARDGVLVQTVDKPATFKAV